MTILLGDAGTQVARGHHPGGLYDGSIRPDLVTVPLHGVEPGHVVLATRAADRSRLVEAFRKSARDCLTSAVPAQTPGLPAAQSGE